MTIKIWN